MNYYEKEVLRMRRNFYFSFQIYQGRILLQKTLCVQMMQKINQFNFPNEYVWIYAMQKRLYDEIQRIYTQLLAHERNQ